MHFEKKIGFLCIIFCLLINIEGNSLRSKRQWEWDDQTPRTSLATEKLTTSTTLKPSTTTSTADQGRITEEECKNKCYRIVSNKYDPVCGTDFTSYDNLEELKCISNCGKEILMLYKGEC
nr:uncharacterized protein LOC111428492 [Onthophagus taurus]